MRQQSRGTLLTGDGDDPSAATTMPGPAMLGQPPGTKGASHTYQVDFVDGRKKALVLAPDAARHLFARTGDVPFPISRWWIVSSGGTACAIGHQTLDASPTSKEALGCLTCDCLAQPLE